MATSAPTCAHGHTACAHGQPRRRPGWGCWKGRVSTALIEEEVMSEYVDLLARVAAPANEGRAIPDPATGEIVGHVREQSVADLEAAIAAAKAAQPAWAALGHPKRIELLLAVADRIDAQAEPLAELLS